MTSVLMLFLLKLTILLALGGALAALLRGRSAATRHFVWALTLWSTVVLGIVANVAPPLTLAIPDWRQSETSTPNASSALIPSALPAAREASGRVSAARLSPRQGEAAKTMPPALEALLAGAWLTGFAAMLVWSTAGHAAVSRIVRGAVPADGAPWAALIEEAHQRIGGTRSVRVALSPLVGAPFTSGWSRPIVLLPAGASAWPADRRRAALMHELAHIERNDYLTHLLAGFACALYWFHPLAWFALRRLRRESEHATDDRVIARGMIARDYATHLLDVARAARGRRFADLLIVGMACPSHLETRLRVLLDETRLRGRLSPRLAAVVTAGVALLVVPLAAAQPELRAPEGEAVKPRQSIADGAKDGDSWTFRRVLEASSGGTLVLDLETGASVRILGGKEPQVEIRANLKGRDAGTTLVEAAAAGDEIRVTSKFERSGGSASTSHAFVVRVPRRFNVRLNSAGGDLSIADVEGTFEGTTGGGSIELTRLQGRAKLTTGGGTIEVIDSDLEGRVSTGGGEVRFVRVRGGLRGASGTNAVVRANDDLQTFESPNDLSDLPDIQTGDEDRARVRGLPARATSPRMLEISKAGGSVDLYEAPHGAVISTGGGRITVGRAEGTVDASTGGGRIGIGPVAGSVRAVTGAGNVDIQVVGAGGQEQTVEVTTGKGNVVVMLPSGFDGRFDIETAYTASHGPVRIQSAWSLDNEPVTDWDAREGTPRRYVRAHGSAGTGRGLVRIRAVNGDVTLRRGD